MVLQSSSTRAVAISWALEKIRFLTSWPSHKLWNTCYTLQIFFRLFAWTKFLKPIHKPNHIFCDPDFKKKKKFELGFLDLEPIFRVCFLKLINDPVKAQSFHLADRGALLASPTSSQPHFSQKNIRISFLDLLLFLPRQIWKGCSGLETQA